MLGWMVETRGCKLAGQNYATPNAKMEQVKGGPRASMRGGLVLSILTYPVSRERAPRSPGGQVSGGTSHPAGYVGEAAIKGRCGKRERIKATLLCASAMEAESLPFITSPAGVFILVTVVFGREDSF